MNLLPWLRGSPREGMVENRPCLDVLTHAVLILGVLVVAFPVYVTFVASTHHGRGGAGGADAADARGRTWSRTTRRPGCTGAGNSAAPVWQMMINSLVSALVIAIGKIAISLLSAFAIVYFKFPGAHVLLLDDLRDADAARRGAHPAHVQGRLRPRHARQLHRAHAAADRVGDGDVPVPPVLPHHPRRARRGRAHRRRRADAVLLGRRRADVARPAWRRCSSSSSSTAGTSTCGR